MSRPETMQCALVVGEALIDVVLDVDGGRREYPGGSAANAAVALARLGRDVAFATSYGHDERGQRLTSYLQDSGVRLAADSHVLPHTSTAVAHIGEDGSADYDFDIDWRVPQLGEVDPVVVAYGSLACVLEPGASDVVRIAHAWRGRALTYFDVNTRPAVTGVGPEVAARAEEFVAVSDLVKASDEDLMALWPGNDEQFVVSRFLDAGAAAVVVTRGAAGATWFGPGGGVDVSMEPVEVADTIGAGDTFGAAVVDALWTRGVVGPGAARRLRDLTPSECDEIMQYAARAAAITVSRPGADPPTRAEMEPGRDR